MHIFARIQKNLYRFLEQRRDKVDFMSVPVIGTAEFKVQKLSELYKKGKMLFNTEYQRTFVWKKSKKQLLIDSILRDYDINKIFLRQKANGTYECLDGQQRMRSIFQYMGSDGQEKMFALAEKSPVGARRFNELTPEFKYKLLYYTIDAVVVYQASEEIVTDLFLRLQEGIPLNSAEKLNAMHGLFRNKVFELSSHHFLEKIGFSNFRFTHRYLCAQIALLEQINDELPTDGYNISPTKYAELKRLYELHKEEAPLQSFKRAKKTFNFLEAALGSSSREIKRKSDFVPMYLLASYLLRKYAMTGKRQKFREFLESFIAKVASIEDVNAAHEEEEIPYYEYKIARRGSIDTKLSMEGGFEAMLTKFLERNPDLQLKDPQRAFDYGQRLAIYLRDKKKCTDCGVQLQFDEGEFHHVKFWENAGPTTVENGVLLCHPCHMQRHGGN